MNRIKKRSLFLVCLILIISPGLIAADLGDVDEDNDITIIDALMVAQYYVGIDVPDINTGLADVNCTGTINILDALLIAQLYVGLIKEFPTPTPTPPPPLSPTPVNWTALQELIPLNPTEKNMLFQNDFVVLKNYKEDILSAKYYDLYDQFEIPLFVTTDAMLHLFHLTYSHMMETLEETKFYEDIYNLLMVLKVLAETEFNTISGNNTPYLETACLGVWKYLVIALALIMGEDVITTEMAIPQTAIDEANEELGRILSYATPGPVNGDYTEYIPRGHYDGDSDLENYFRALKWLRKREFDVEDPHDLGAAAILGSIIVQYTEVEELWLEIYSLFNKLVNQSNSITPLEINNQIMAMNNDILDYSILEDSQKQDELKEALLAETAFKNKWVELLGEPFLLDTDTMRMTVDDYVPGRYMPAPLDVASTVMNSNTSYLLQEPELINDLLLEEQINYLRDDLYSQVDWTTSTYNLWYYLLRSLSETIESPHIPGFFNSTPWAKQKLNTQLASWAELRSDNSNIIQSVYTPTPTPTPIPTPGSTDPVPTSTLSPPSDAVLLEVEYKCSNPAASSVYLEPHIKVLNTGINSVSLDSVTIRYFYTKEGSSTEEFNVDYAILGNDNVTGAIHDEYIEIGFSSGAGVLSPGTDTGEIQVRVNKTDWSFYDQTNDYSFDASITDFTSFIKICAYVDGRFVWGKDTSGATPQPPTPAPPTIAPTDSPPSPTPTPTPLPGYVEPYPEFYLRYSELNQHIIDSLENYANPHKEKFILLRDWANDFNIISGKLADGTLLDPEDHEMITLWGRDLIEKFFNTQAFIADESMAEIQVIADIFSYQDRVLHIGTGKLNPVIILYQLPGKEERIAAIGYGMSYYEIEADSYNRLQDSTWEDWLSGAATGVPVPRRPEWTADFLGF